MCLCRNNPELCKTEVWSSAAFQSTLKCKKMCSFCHCVKSWSAFFTSLPSSSTAVFDWIHASMKPNHVCVCVCVDFLVWNILTAGVVITWRAMMMTPWEVRRTHFGPISRCFELLNVAFAALWFLNPDSVTFLFSKQLQYEGPIFERDWNYFRRNLSTGIFLKRNRVLESRNSWHQRQLPLISPAVCVCTSFGVNDFPTILPRKQSRVPLFWQQLRLLWREEEMYKRVKIWLQTAMIEVDFRLSSVSRIIASLLKFPSSRSKKYNWYNKKCCPLTEKSPSGSDL